jgi:hypothetical protein
MAPKPRCNFREVDAEGAGEVSRFNLCAMPSRKRDDVGDAAVEVSMVERDLSAEARKIGKSGAIQTATVLADKRYNQ